MAVFTSENQILEMAVAVGTGMISISSLNLPVYPIHYSLQPQQLVQPEWIIHLMLVTTQRITNFSTYLQEPQKIISERFGAAPPKQIPTKKN